MDSLSSKVNETALPLEGEITVEHVHFDTPLWFRQSWRNTLWLLTHRWPWNPMWWATLIGLCPYCRRWDCVD